MSTFMSHIKISSAVRILLLMCFCLPLLTSCESRKTIVNSLDEREANEIIVFLSTKGIDATKVQSTAAAGGGGGAKVVLWDISVPDNQSLEAMSLLNQAGLPRRRSENLLNIFTGAGLVPSEMEQRIRAQSGLAAQIASTIRKIDGVLDAEVQLAFPEEDPLNPTAKKQPITASVYVKHNGVLDDPNSHLQTKIKRLVAASVPGLDYDNVTVIGERARFSDLSLNPTSSEEEKQYVSVWSIILAKESVSRFRIIFFSFTLLILLLLLALLWLCWKFYPVLRAHGGLKELFHLKPIPTEKTLETAKTEESKEPPKEPSKEAPAAGGEAQEKSVADKDVDQT
jgi:type III secretion protein J